MNEPLLILTFGDIIKLVMFVLFLVAIPEYLAWVRIRKQIKREENEDD